MSETIFELTGEEREKRIAELKRKMQEAAKKAQAAHAAGEEGSSGSTEASTAPAARPAAATAAAPAATQAPAVTRPARETQPPSGNGSAAPAARPATPRPVTPRPQAQVAEAEAELSTAEMNRREFLTYAWAGALGLLALETGVVSYFFMYPRFRAGEFGGEFFLGSTSALPEPTAPPMGYTDGKFWLITTQDGDPKALYMVCTHLGCLYKWEQSNNRFECPCHGSKFSHDGFYIEGPAPRSLDYFEVRVEEGELIVDTGAKIVGDPAAESPARQAPV